jgi:integrase
MRKTIDTHNNVQFRRCFEFYLNTGARRAEGLNLEWKDVNFERKFVFLRHTKTGKTRMIPMNDTLYSILKEMYQENNEGNLFNYSEDAVTRQFKRYLRKSGIKKDLHLHNLRDTFTSHLIMNGVDLLTVSKYMGNSVRIIEKHYGHLSSGYYYDSIKKLPF